LSGANLSFANLGETVFIDTDMSRIIGLESCLHLGPSVIDHRTVTKSGGLPLMFLRGCGLPDEFIEALSNYRLLLSCFLSYSTQDQEFAERLYVDLQSKGVRCWFAPHDIKGAKK
jgi:hypothetical protein